MDTTQRNSWNALSMKEKAAMMKVAVQNGIYNLDDIRQAYNEYAEGGNTEDEYYAGTLPEVRATLESGIIDNEGPYRNDTYYGRPLEQGLINVSPEFDALLIGRVAANAAREAAGKLLNSGIEGTARQRAAITSRRFGREMAKRRDEVKGWSRTLVDDIKDGNYADVPLDLKGLARNVWETGRYIKNTPERYAENTLPRFYRNVFRRTYNNTKPAIPMIFSDPENNE